MSWWSGREAEKVFKGDILNSSGERLKQLRYLKDKLEFLLGSNPPKTNMTGWKIAPILKMYRFPIEIGDYPMSW